MHAVVVKFAFKLILKGLFRKLACRLSSSKFLLTCVRNVDGNFSTVSSPICYQRFSGQFSLAAVLNDVSI